MLQAATESKASCKDDVFSKLEKAIRDCLPSVCNPSFYLSAPATPGNQERVLEVRLGQSYSWKPELLFKKIGATESEQKASEYVFRGRLDGYDYTLRVISSQPASKNEVKIHRTLKSYRSRQGAASTSAVNNSVTAD